MYLINSCANLKPRFFTTLNLQKLINQTKKAFTLFYAKAWFGATETIRTSDLSLRRRSLLSSWATWANMKLCRIWKIPRGHRALTFLQKYTKRRQTGCQKSWGVDAISQIRRFSRVFGAVWGGRGRQSNTLGGECSIRLSYVGTTQLL